MNTSYTCVWLPNKDEVVKPECESRVYLHQEEPIVKKGFALILFVDGSNEEIHNVTIAPGPRHLVWLPW